MKQQINRYPDSKSTDISLTDFSPTVISPVNSSSRDTSPNGQFTEQTFIRRTVSRMTHFISGIKKSEIWNEWRKQFNVYLIW